MARIEEIFPEYFEKWRIRLPEEAVRSRQRGEIRSHGWHIQYLFGEDDQGEFMDFYATLRMTNDRHVRIYARGELVYLPSYQEHMIFPAEASEEEEQRIQEEYYRYNWSVSEELKKKGFLQIV